MKKFMIVSLIGLALSTPVATFCMENDGKVDDERDTGDGDGGCWNFEYADSDADEAVQQADPFGAMEDFPTHISTPRANSPVEPQEPVASAGKQVVSTNPLVELIDGHYEFYLPEEDEFADVAGEHAKLLSEPEDSANVVKRFVDDVFKQVANTNPLIGFMRKTWPIDLNDFDPAESNRRAVSVEHMGAFIALLRQCSDWVNRPVKMDDGRWDETLLSFAIASAAPKPVLQAICDAGARVTRENVDHANIWRSVQGKPHLAEVTKFIKQRFAEQEAEEKAKARN